MEFHKTSFTTTLFCFIVASALHLTSSFELSSNETGAHSLDYHSSPVQYPTFETETNVPINNTIPELQHLQPFPTPNTFPYISPSPNINEPKVTDKLCNDGYYPVIVSSSAYQTPDRQHQASIICQPNKQLCTNWGTCSQKCSQVSDSQVKCDCNPGYHLADDNVTCKSDSKQNPLVIYSLRTEIKTYQLNSKQDHPKAKTLMSGLRNTVALDFYIGEKTNYIFWTDVVEERIYRGTFIDETITNIDYIIHGSLSTAEGLAIDWVGKNIYWVESTLDHIEVANFNGTMRRVLIAGDMGNPRSIAVDPRYGYIFWSDWDKNMPRIERATMSGTDRKVIIKIKEKSISSDNGSWPNGITLDYDNDRLYWIDAFSDSIHSTDYDGKNEQLILRDVKSLGHPFSITTFENNVYWTDWRSTSVSTANKFFGTNVREIQKGARPFDIKIFHPDKQPRVDPKLNPCHLNHGDCSHLCLLSTNNTRTCNCPHLMTISEDGITCKPSEKAILIGKSHEIRIVDVNNPLYNLISPISIPKVDSPAQFDFDAASKHIFWIDSHLNEIKKTHLTEGTIETIIDVAIESPTSIALDWISKTIYVASTPQTLSGAKIYVSNLKGEYISVLLDHPNELIAPKHIAVHPSKGLLFVIDEEITLTHEAKYHPIILSFSMDGTNRQIISSRSTNPELENPSSLIVDVENNRVYWMNLNNKYENASAKSIQYYDINEDKVVSYWNEVASLNEERISVPNIMTVDGGKLLMNSRLYPDTLINVPTSDSLNKSVFKCPGANEITALKVYNSSAQFGSNACSANNGGCSQLCLPKNSTHRSCKCTIGFENNPTQDTECVGKNQFLIYSYNWGMKGISLQPETALEELYLTPIHKALKASSIDFVYEDSLIYWVDNEEGSITRINRDTTGLKVIVQNLESEQSIAIDWVAGNIYWLYPYYDIIEVARLDGSNRYVVVSGDIDKANCIVVNPLRGYIAWSSSGLSSKIEVALLDGSNRTRIVNSIIGHVNDLTIDYKEDYIYWLNTQFSSVEKVRPDGSERQQVYAQYSKSLPGPSQTNHPVAIAVYEDYLYIADSVYYSGSIVRYEKMDTTKKAVIQHKLGDGIKDIAIYAEQSIPSSSLNPCVRDNGECQDLCLFTGKPGVRRCVCSHGKLNEDKKSCRPYDTFIMYSRTRQIDSLHVKDEDGLNNSPYAAVAFENRSTIISLTSDYESKRIIYSDIGGQGQIVSMLYNGSDQTVLISKQGFVEGVFFNNNQLYWTSITEYSVFRLNITSTGVLMNKCLNETDCNLNNTEKLIRLTKKDKPRGIVVDKCTDSIYWTNWQDDAPAIQRASHRSNYQVESIITTAIRVPNGIAIDQERRKLYWCDARLDKIEYCEMDGTNRVVLLQQFPQHPFALSVWDNYVVWTDWLARGVFRADKYTGQNPVQIKKIGQKPMGIVIVAPSIQNCQTTKCGSGLNDSTACLSERYRSHNVNLSQKKASCGKTNSTACDILKKDTIAENFSLESLDATKQKKKNNTNHHNHSTTQQPKIWSTTTLQPDIETSGAKISSKTLSPSTIVPDKSVYATTVAASTIATPSPCNSAPINATPSPLPCHSNNLFRCHMSEKLICIGLSSKCDGVGDCPNGEDETECLYSTAAKTQINTKQDSKWQLVTLVSFFLVSSAVTLFFVLGSRSKPKRWFNHNNGFNHRRLFDDVTNTNIEISNPMFEEDDNGNILSCPFSIDLNERSTNFTNPLLTVGSRRKF